MAAAPPEDRRGGCASMMSVAAASPAPILIEDKRGSLLASTLRTWHPIGDVDEQLPLHASPPALSTPRGDIQRPIRVY